MQCGIFTLLFYTDNLTKMKKIYYCFLLLLVSVTASAALYTSPGTGVRWDLNTLVANAGGNITFSGTEYLVSDLITINTNDTLEITTDEVVKFSPTILFTIKGVLLIAPPNNVLFTAVDPVTGYTGLRLEFSDSSKINKLTYEYANTLTIADCSPRITNSTFRFNGQNAAGTEGAVNLFRSKAFISNCTFLENRRAAIQGGSNIANAPTIINCSLLQNNTSNSNRPQINLGSTGTDTAKIIGCQIIGGNIMSGGIGFLPTGTVYAFINQNLIKGNRYGITLNGGSNINCMVSYNRVEDNNIQNDPNLGGSGIAFSGGTSTSHQNTIVTGNTFSNNLWGITIVRLSGTTPISGSMPNLGNLNNADTSDDGKNRFINNTNATTPGIDLYNNSSDPIFAMGNYWNTNIDLEIEAKIFHQTDQANLGLVTYSGFILPVELLSFTATRQNNDVALQWKTAQETNSHHFEIEKSYDGTSFGAIANKTAAGNSNTILVYNYTDLNAGSYGGTVYYRIKSVDIDGSFKYSNVVAVVFPTKTATRLIRYYPTAIAAGMPLTTELMSNKGQKMTLQYFDANGRLLANNAVTLIQGFNKIDVAIPAKIKGAVMVKLNAESFSKTISIIIQ